MRCYEIVAKSGGKTLEIQFAANEGDARKMRNEMMVLLSLTKKEISISPTEIPTTKMELLGYLNNHVDRLDI